jgi:uncharacterized membrane protein
MACHAIVGNRFPVLRKHPQVLFQSIVPHRLIAEAHTESSTRLSSFRRMTMSLYILALLIGVIAGLRTMTAPAAVSWAAALGWLNLQDTWLAFLGFRFTPYIFTVLALAELVTDQLPQTPSRKVPVQFGARVVSGGLCGAAIGASGGAWIGGLVAGVIGAGLGTLGGAELRSGLAKAFGKDMPAALIEDVIAIGGAFLIVHAFASGSI